VKKNTLIIIAGPTAVGKTALAISLAEHFHTEVISADSRQFFREMNIGTAKPSREELLQVPHHFIDSHSLTEEYNVSRFETEALACMQNRFKDHPVIIMAGGSGLYIDAVCQGFDALPEADPLVRKKIAALLEKEGLTALQELLKKLDPDFYSQADLQNPQRLSRALEVCLSSGKAYSAFRKGKKKERDFNILKIGLELPREILYDRINERVDEMMRRGLVEEARGLLPYKNRNALQTVGYRELFDHLEGKTDLPTAVELIKQHTRNFAKRQLTWFKRDEEMTWFSPEKKEEIMEHINKNLPLRH
jgi:tRNA dimethylallyltransferase